MRLQISYINPRSRLKAGPLQVLIEDYCLRAQGYQTVTLHGFRREADLLDSALPQTGRTRPFTILLDSRGRQLTSEQFAEVLGQQRDLGIQQVILAIGPADGWSAAGRLRADLLLSLGAITLPHELALLILAEQTYRALTILAGHPYHSGHA